MQYTWLDAAQAIDHHLQWRRNGTSMGKDIELNGENFSAGIFKDSNSKEVYSQASN